MADAVVPPSPRRRRRVFRTLAWLAGVFIALVVVVYFVVTSSAFFKGVILPRVGASMNADVTAGSVSISPFSQIILRDLKVQPKGAEPLLTATEIRARYSLLGILGGTIKVDEVTLVSPTITLVENPDGSSNLDPILKTQQKEKKEKKPERAAQLSEPLQIDLKKIALNNGTIRQVKNYKGGGRDVTELSGVNLALENLKNGRTGKLTMNADIKVENNPPAPGTNGLLQAKVSGSFIFDLSADLKPVTIRGQTHMDVQRAEGAMTDLTALGADLECEVTPTEIKQVALRFQKAGASLGQLRASGPFDPEKTEGRLSVEILSLDRQVLNLIGAASGIDFGTTTLNSTNQIEFTEGGSVVKAVGKLDGDKVQVTRQRQTTPALDVRVNYDLTIHRTTKSALLRTMTLSGTQNQQPLVRAELTSPMSLAWGNVSNALGESALNLTVTNLNLADWKPFLGEMAPVGNMNLRMKLLSQQGGKQLTFDLSSQIENLTAKFGSNQIAQARVALEARGQATDLKKFDLSKYDLRLAQQNQPILSVSGTGTFDSDDQAADMSVSLEAALPVLLKVLGRPDASASAGKLNLTARTTQKQQQQSVTGKLILTDFTGRFENYRFEKFGVTADLDIQSKDQQLQIRKAAGSLTEGADAGGSFDASGNFDLAKKSGQLELKLANFNQNGLRPFLESMLGDKKLVSVSLNSTASVRYDVQGDSAVKANLQLTNLVVSDPENKIPATPLEAKFVVDASVHKQAAEVRQFQITLSPTARAKNELQFKGQVDLSQTNAMQGSLKLAAESLDVTPYYDLFAGKPEPAVKKKATPASPTTQTAAVELARTEPEPIRLPVKDVILDVNIGRFYLREVEITNLHTTAKIEGSHVVVKPLQLVLNGAPVNASLDLDLGVPGYKYNVSFAGNNIPLAPLVNSFQPERKGDFGGVATAQVTVAGAGITDASLQKNLGGKFDINSTNLNLSIANIRSRTLKALINVIAALPNLVRNPEAAVGNLLGRLTGDPAARGGGGWVDELTQSPIDTIAARGTISAGRVDLQRAFVQSAAFQAEASGRVVLAPVLTNSKLNVPVSVSLERTLAVSVSLASAGTPTNVTYVKLPDFVTMKGTVSDPKTDINKLALVGLAAKVGGGVLGNTGSKAGIIVEGIGNILGGQSSPSTNQAGTNQPEINLFDLLKKPKK